ncbi:MAG TPA: phosphoglycerate kinase [Candidatus Nanoarchaeia archaeon]|nr:phosphoglycerate kinase [Candidatus Nanoarchaeia archaeon]
MHSLKDMDFGGKRVLLRVDFNVPLDDAGRVVNDKRIRETLPTINYLVSKKAKIIVLTHVGRPSGDTTEELRTTTISYHLSKLLHIPVKKIDDCIGANVHKAAAAMKPGDVVMLENVRFYDGEKNKDVKKRLEFAKQLALLADIYVNDAFANSHRDHASMTGVPQFIPGCMGFVVEQEVEKISRALNEEKRPFISIVGGLKADKLKAIKHLVKKSDKVLVGGSLAFLFLKAQGKHIGSTKIDEECDVSSNELKELLKSNKIVLPTDCVLADKFSRDARISVLATHQIKNGAIAVDIGPETIKSYTDAIKNAATIVWNGPMGAYEIELFARGTNAVAHAIASTNATKIIGGGESAAAVEMNKLEGKMTHVSTGGGASLMMFQGDTLPALAALEESAKKFI